jgi:formate dehydrogenase subunit delta
MHPDHLIQMANRVGQFFEAQPDRAQALADTAAHIHKFWAPSQRADLANWLHTEGGRDLTPFVHEALSRHPQALQADVRSNPAPDGR